MLEKTRVHLHVRIAFAIYEKFQGTSFIDKHLYLLCTKIKTFIGRLYVQIFFIIFPPESDFYAYIHICGLFVCLFVLHKRPAQGE